jgi:hypothetical protein
MEIWGGNSNTSPGEMKRKREREKKGEKEGKDKVIEHYTETQTWMEENTMAAI